MFLNFLNGNLISEGTPDGIHIFKYVAIGQTSALYKMGNIVTSSYRLAKDLLMIRS